MDDGRSGRPNNATADENVMVVHTLVMCDRRQVLLSIANDLSDFIELVVTKVETWVHHLDLEPKMQSKQGSTLTHPLLRNLRGFIQQGR